VSFEIPIDKIGEVIGPKGKVINTIQQETGADISVSDDGMVGTVSIGSKDGAAVEEGRRRVMLILEPPTAELGAEYTGRVVNITKFGAFVNILPGRDGLVHISKLGRGKRIDRVEDVLSLGDELSVRVDDIDNSGKLSLSIVGEDGEVEGGAETGGRRDEPREARGDGADDASGGRRESASFEDFWEGQAREEFGELGPADERAGAGAGGRSGDRGGDRRRGGGGRGRRPRR
jgi:polyribonucleotide nucleotidyltransferase